MGLKLCKISVSQSVRHHFLVFQNMENEYGAVWRKLIKERKRSSLERKRSSFLQGELSELQEQFKNLLSENETLRKDKQILLDRVANEAKTRAGIWTTKYVFCWSKPPNFHDICRTLHPRLDVGDVKTICNTPKYLALKREVESRGVGGEQMVILTHHGVHYLKSSWNLDVDKNGKTRKADQTKTPISGSDYRASQQLDSKILSFVTKYYVEPKKK